MKTMHCWELENTKNHFDLTEIFALRLFKMVANSKKCFRLEQKSFMKLLLAEKCKPCDIYRRLSADTMQPSRICHVTQRENGQLSLSWEILWIGKLAIYPDDLIGYRKYSSNLIAFFKKIHLLSSWLFLIQYFDQYHKTIENSTKLKKRSYKSFRCLCNK